jgi:aldose 1-epimerase
MDSLVRLEAQQPVESQGSGFLEAYILPSRGFMLLQVRARTRDIGEFDVLKTPPLEEAVSQFSRSDENGLLVPSFRMGAALLLPFANRIRGELLPDGSSIRTSVFGQEVVLPANWGGSKRGAERFAMHGLFLNRLIDSWSLVNTDTGQRAHARFFAGDFDGAWIGSCEIEIVHALNWDSYSLAITARNVGRDPLPFGVGWHPYFAIPSGRRQQARVHIPASRRFIVNNYDEVLPTGVEAAVAESMYDFSYHGGRPLAENYYDDCYTDLRRDAAGEVVARMIDPSARYHLRITGSSAAINSIQLYAPPEHDYIVLEHQYNRPDPFGSEWRDSQLGDMVILEPGGTTVFNVRLELPPYDNAGKRRR